MQLRLYWFILFYSLLRPDYDTSKNQNVQEADNRERPKVF